MKKRKSIKCLYCGVTIPWAGKGRKPNYCQPSHRQRAYEARRLKRASADHLICAFKRDLAELHSRHSEAKMRQVTLNVLEEKGLIPQIKQGKRRLLELVKKGPAEKNDK